MIFFPTASHILYHLRTTLWWKGPCFQPIRCSAAPRPLRFHPLLSITLVLGLLMSRVRSYRVSGSEEDGGRRRGLVSERWSDCRSVGVVQSAEVCVARAISLSLKWETPSLSVSGDWHQIGGTGASVALHANNLASLPSVCLFPQQSFESIKLLLAHSEKHDISVTYWLYWSVLDIYLYTLIFHTCPFSLCYVNNLKPFYWLQHKPVETSFSESELIIWGPVSHLIVVVCYSSMFVFQTQSTKHSKLCVSTQSVIIMSKN